MKNFIIISWLLVSLLIAGNGLAQSGSTPCSTTGRWTSLKRISGNGDDLAVQVTTDNAGNQYVIGDFSSQASITGEQNTTRTLTSAGSYDAFVAKYSGNGQLLWVQTVAGSRQESGRGIHIDGSRLYITGSTRSNNISISGSTINFGTLSDENPDGFFICLNATNGSLMWSRQIKGAEGQSGYAITTSNNGDVYVGGTSRAASGGGVSGESLTTFGSDINGANIILRNGTCFIAKYRNSDGALLWANHLSGANGSMDILSDISFYNGKVYSTGRYLGTVSVNGSNHISQGMDIFIMQQNAATGVIERFIRAGGAGTDSGLDIDITGAGTIMLAGEFANSATFGNQSVSSRGDTDIFLAEYDLNGTVLFLKSIGSTGTDYATKFARDNADNIYLTGVVGVNLDFDGQPLQVTGTGDVFVANFKKNTAPSGISNKWQLEWVINGEEQGFSVGADIHLDASGTLYIVGRFSNDLSIGPNTLVDNPNQNGDGFIAAIQVGFLPTITISSINKTMCQFTVTFTANCFPAGNHLYKAFLHSGLGVVTEIATVSGGNGSVSFSFGIDNLNLAEGAYRLEVRNTNERISSASVVLNIDPWDCIFALCESTQRSASVFSVSPTGLIMYGPPGGCPTDSVYACLSGGAAAQTRVVATAATTFTPNWIPQGYTGTNPYEDGYAGKWRAQTTYAYNTPLTQEEGLRNRNYVNGTFTATPFSWKSGGNPQSWVPATTVTQYSINGEATEERDVLGNYSTAKFGYAGSVPYLVAQNAAHNQVLYESFENSYALSNSFEDNIPIQGVLTPVAHSGRYSVQIQNGNFDLRPFVMTNLFKNSGLWCKVWIRVGNGREKDLAGMQQEAARLQLRLSGTVAKALRAVAQVGEWTLCEALLLPAELSAISSNTAFTPKLIYSGSGPLLIDDLRVQPADAQMVCYVYDESLRPVASFDDQHFGMYYQYNSEGKLVRKLIETERGMKTVQETQYNLPKVAR